MRVLAPTAEGLALAAARLAAGAVVAIPTETVYGLAGRAFDEHALAQIFAAKDRPTFDPLNVHVLGLDAEGVIGPLAPAQRATAERLARAYWPGPLTLVLPRGARVPDLATSGLPTVAVRAPRHPVAQKLIAAVGPLAAPSANRFGRISPTSAADVVAELGDRVELVVDGGPCDVGLESTIVAIDEGGGLTLLRPGGVPLDGLELAGGPVRAPGMLPSHYAPRKPLYFLGEPAPPGRVGLLVFDPAAAARVAAVRVEVLGLDLETAARRLFAALRALDASDADILVAERCPTRAGLGHAIADRLERAAAPKLR
jgi:L-threonylcarbamoyladenylate synthase